MFYSLDIADYPKVKRIYTVTRNTVWQISEKEHLLIFIRHGECTFTIDGEEIILSQGDVLYLPPETAYVRRPVGEKMCTMMYIHFTTESKSIQHEHEALSKMLSEMKAKKDSEMLLGEESEKDFSTVFLQTKQSPKDNERIYSFLPGISAYTSGRHFMSRLMSSSRLSAILCELSENTVNLLLSEKRSIKGKTVPPKLKKAVEYIARHYSEKITLDEISAHCAVSKQQMIRYFRSAFGTTPSNYITEYKLSRAKELLFNNPQLTVKEISNELGFEDQHYFSRVFTKANGETPTQFRYRTLNYSKISRKKK